MFQAKTMAGVINVITMLTIVKSVTFSIVVTMVMWVCRDISAESGVKLVYVAAVW
jgi:hypothetical protein